MTINRQVAWLLTYRERARMSHGMRKATYSKTRVHANNCARSWMWRGLLTLMICFVTFHASVRVTAHRIQFLDSDWPERDTPDARGARECLGVTAGAKGIAPFPDFSPIFPLSRKSLKFRHFRHILPWKPFSPKTPKTPENRKTHQARTLTKTRRNFRHFPLSHRHPDTPTTQKCDLPSRHFRHELPCEFP